MDQLLKDRIWYLYVLIAVVVTAISLSINFIVSARGLLETDPPTNPAFCVENNGIGNGTWQNIVNDPSFTWDPGFDAESGVDGYYVYWGTDPAGTSNFYQSSITTFDPPGVQSGTYYLRLNTKDFDGNLAGWTTMFTFRYDISPPDSGSAYAVDINGSINDTWQNYISNPSFSVQGVLEPGSGVSGFYFYWGQEINGTSADFSAATTFTPATVSEGTSYLRIRAVDNLGNEEPGWSTIYTFLYDITSPAAPSGPSGEINGVVSNSWQSMITAPTFNWAPTNDAASFDVYFGSDVVGTNAVNVSTASYSPGLIASSGTYYLRVRTVDAAGNKSAWIDLFTFLLDIDPPEWITGFAEDHFWPNNTCQSFFREPIFSWLPSNDIHSGVNHYKYYWGPLIDGFSDNYTLIPYIAPGIIPKNNINYFRLAAVDSAGNVSNWQTKFAFCHGEQVAVNPIGLQMSYLLDDVEPFEVKFNFPYDSYLTEFYLRLWTQKEPPEPPAGYEKLSGLEPFTISLTQVAFPIDPPGLFKLPDLDNPYKINIKYTPESTLSLNDSTLKIYRWDEEKKTWKVLANSYVDTLNRIVHGSSPTSELFAVFGQSIPEQDRLNIQTGKIQFGSLILSGETQEIIGTTLPWTILDARLDDFGWSVVINSSDFTNEDGHIIPSENLTIQILPEDIVILIGTNTPISHAVNPLPLSNISLTILHADFGSSKGKYIITPLFRFLIPADSYKGTYKNEITVTIISGPT